MADFAAVLRKTIAALKENTPEARAKIYQKARSTIDAKLKAINPPPPAHLIEKQLRMLEDAITAVEAEFAAPVIADKPKDDLDDILKELEALSKSPSTAAWKPSPAIAPTPVVPPYSAADVASDRTVEPEPVQEAEPDTFASSEDESSALAAPAEEEPVAATDEPVSTDSDEAPVAETEQGGPDAPRQVEEASSHGAETDWPEAAAEPAVEAGPFDYPEPAAPEAEHDARAEPEAKRDVDPSGDPDHAAPATEGSLSTGPEHDLFEERPALRELRDRREAKRSLKRPLIAAGILIALAAAGAAGWVYRDDLAQQVASLTGGLSGEEDDTPTDVAEAPAEEPEENTSGAGQNQTVAAQQPVRKLTQRLLPDGTEVDEGPASGSPSVGEGTSIAASTETAATQPGASDNQPRDEAAVAIGQKAIFYEERTVQEQASASDGTVVWSIQEESPGTGLPPEPVIYAEATIPAKRLSLKMSIRRNIDQSLPASYIAELIFLTPDDFPGGAVGNVASISLKRTEQEAGNRLLGIPAKIADGFFLVALSDNKADMEANNLLLDRMEWIDIPIVYTSGRRALITLEKGAPGGKIFSEALAAWKQATSG